MPATLDLYTLLSNSTTVQQLHKLHITQNDTLAQSEFKAFEIQAEPMLTRMTSSAPKIAQKCTIVVTYLK